MRLGKKSKTAKAIMLLQRHLIYTMSHFVSVLLKVNLGCTFLSGSKFYSDVKKRLYMYYVANV